ncbi:MAG TPA: hypothetical protein VFD48_12315 [Pyrinomonadaceae bacterium]|nr:hypothetical protein [Pyrinomonadaceae bacterium]
MIVGRHAHAPGFLSFLAGVHAEVQLSQTATVIVHAVAETTAERRAALITRAPYTGSEAVVIRIFAVVYTVAEVIGAVDKIRYFTGVDMADQVVVR